MNDRISPDKPSASSRLASLDAYRGFVMLLMMAEVCNLASVSHARPNSAIWAFLAHHQTHVEWVGCSLHDMIQPSFSFLVGVALPFSLAVRLARGQSVIRMSLHAWWRSLMLILLGVWLRSIHSDQTNWTFEDTLSQIGLGYGFLFLLGFRSMRTQGIVFGVLLIGYFLAFAMHPLPSADFRYADVGVSKHWLMNHGLSGFAAHWQKNSNFAWSFDTWWMNLFPRKDPFVANSGGYSTLSFIPTLGTMILGLLTGGVLRSTRPQSAKVRWLLLVGCAGLAIGWLLGVSGICPVVKRIWTPSWVLFSGGWCLLLTAGFFTIIEIWHRKAWAYPLLVVGANSIAAYCMAHLFEGFIAKNLETHLGKQIFQLAGADYECLLRGAAILLVFWLILFWMDRRKILLRI